MITTMIVVTTVIAVGALAVGWLMNRPSRKPDPVQTAQQKQDALKPTEQAITKATTSGEVAEQWNNLMGEKRP